MSSLIAAVHSVRLRFDLGSDDDIADKLSNRYTVALLLIFCVVVSTKQYVGDPIDCWVDSRFNGAMRDYTENLCWIKNTYYLDIKEIVIPVDKEIVEGKEINYYQWVPILLSVQAFLFYFPYMVWKVLSSRMGCDLKHIARMFGEASCLNTETREKSVRFAAVHIDRYLMTHERRGGICAQSVCIGRAYGNSMLIIYLIVKVLYLMNAVSQLFGLNAFLGKDYAMYGYRVARGIYLGEEFEGSERFPRSTLCSFRVREFGNNIHRHTVQCVLPINLFNEKIYIFLWFWMTMVGLVTAISIGMWIWTLFPHTRIIFCEQYLKQLPTDRGYSRSDRRDVRTFALTYLRHDGAFFLRLISNNVNEVIMCEIIMALFETYKKRYPQNGVEKHHGRDV